MIFKYENCLYETYYEELMPDNSLAYKCNELNYSENIWYIGIDAEGLEILGDNVEEVMKYLPEELV